MGRIVMIMKSGRGRTNPSSLGGVISYNSITAATYNHSTHARTTQRYRRSVPILTIVKGLKNDTDREKITYTNDCEGLGFHIKHYADKMIKLENSYTTNTEQDNIKSEGKYDVCRCTQIILNYDVALVLTKNRGDNFGKTKDIITANTQ